MKKSVFLPVKKMAVALTVILAGFVSFGNLHGQTQAIISSFYFTLTPSYGFTINEPAGTITVPVYNSANVTNLVAVFTASTGATVKVGGVVQTSGVNVNNFTSVVIYTVTSGDLLSTKNYAVTITRNPALLNKQLHTFSFASVPGAVGVIDEPTFSVTVHVPLTLNVTALAATFTTSPLSKAYVGGVQQTSGVTTNNYTTPLAFTVQAENGSTRVYTVSLVRDPALTGKQLLTFSFPGVTAIIDEGLHTVTATVPFSTLETGLVATFTSSYMSTVKIGSTVQTSGSTANDFTNPVTYRVVAEDITLFQDYVVTVIKAPVETGMSISTFNFETQFDPDIIGVVDQLLKTIVLTVPFSQNVTALVATFTSSPVSTVSIGTVGQTSGVTANNFTSPVVYTCHAENGSTENYTVSISRATASSANDLLTFSFNALDPDAIGVVDGTSKTVVVHVPYGTVKTNLVASFTISPLATAKISAVTQVSGATSNNFTAAVVYQIVAENGSIEIYTVTVITDPNTEKKLLTFAFNGLTPAVNGTISESSKTVQVNIPFSVSRADLVATFTASANSTVLIGAAAQVSGTTHNDFSAAVTYTVKAEDNSLQPYTVTVTNNPVETGNQIIAFSFNTLSPAVVATIDQTAKTIVAVLPFGTARTGLVTTFTKSLLSTVTVATVDQVSGTTANNFTTPVTYRCTSESGVLNDYLVTVTVTPGSSNKDITYFAFEDLNPDVVGVITQTAPATIVATVSYGTDRSALRAFYTASPLSIVRVLGLGGGIQQSGITVNDFRTSLIYEVTAQDGSTKNYTVSVGEPVDITKPVVTNAIYLVSNLPGQFVLVRSNEATGKVFIISDNVNQNTIADLEAAVTAGFGRSQYVSLANTDIPLSTTNLPEGIYHAFAIDAAGNKSLRGINAITVQDRLPPTVSVAAQTKVNSLNNFVNVKSSKTNSLVYLILEGVPQLGKTQLDAAVNAIPKKGVRGLVQSANVDVPLSVYGLLPGNYHAYAVDLSIYNNMSAPSTNVVVITEASRAKSILAFSFNQLEPPAIGQIIGTEISVKLRVGTPVTALVAAFTLSPLSNAFVGLIPQVPAVTPNDFTNPVIYTVTAEDGSSENYTVTVSFNTGVDESEWLNSIKSYPNPVSDKLTIESTRPLDRIRIYNGLGQTMEDIHNPGQTTVEIQTGSWMKGIYFVRYFREEKYIGVQKIIKD